MAETTSPDRLRASQQNVQGYTVIRLCGLIADRTDFRHTLHNSPIPAIAYHRINAEDLRISRAPVSAQWGIGAYVWDASSDMTSRPFVDVRVPPGTLIEELHVDQRRPFYSLLPPEGDFIRVEVTGTNLSGELLQQFAQWDFSQQD